MIKEIIKYKDAIFKDIGLYIAIGICILYLAIFQPWVGDLDIIDIRVWIVGISLAIITLSAGFCYQAHNFLKSIDFENEFYEKLLANGILDEVQFLYRWNVYSGVINIILLVAYNTLIYSRLFDNMVLGTFAVFPMFSTVYLLSEFVNNLRTGIGLSKYNLDYKKIRSKYNDNIIWRRG
jgi:hypothetical protein